MMPALKQSLRVLGFLGLGACRSYGGPVSDHFDGDHFYNPWKKQESSFLDVLKWKLFEKADTWPKWVENNPNPNIPAAYREGDVSITFINHASFLISVGGLNILTDPIWSERTSPLSWIGPKRVRDAGVPFDSLPKIDAVLVSHNHYDHLDLPTLQKLSEKFQPHILVPLGDKNWLTDDHVGRVDEMDWWQTTELSADVKVHFAPSQHWSSRTSIDRNKSLWGAFLIEYKGKIIYIAGDTGYGPHFRYASERFPKIEVALLPIGAYQPRWFMEYAHMNPDDALKAYQDLGAAHAVAMHFGCWQLTDEGIDAPAADLNALIKDKPELATRFVVPEVGGTYRYRF